MANIQTFLEKILSARYGKDVRQSIHDAIVEVDKVADTAQDSATEAAAQAEQYRNETEQLRNEVAEIVPEGYSDLVEQVNENTFKIDTVIEKADLGIKETASGEEIHLTDSAEGKAVEFALYGKATQHREPTPENPQEIEVSGESGIVEVKSVGKNLLEIENTTQSGQGITWTTYDDGRIVANGTANVACTFNIPISLKDGVTYVASGVSGGSIETYHVFLQTSDGLSTSAGYFGNGERTFTKDTDKYNVGTYRCRIASGYTANNLTFYPMIRLATDTDSTFEPYKETLSTIPTENGLAGINVSSGGNYTDQNGQQWICDEVVKYADGSGEKIQRIKKVVLNGSENWILAGSIGKNGFYTDNTIYDGIANISPMMCDMFTSTLVNNANMEDNQIKHGDSAGNVKAFIYLKTSKAETVDELKTFFEENNATCYYILATPIHTPLTAEEIAEIEKLHTFYPITNISNDFDCGMKVKYNCDSKNYIDNKIALLTTAMVNSI